MEFTGVKLPIIVICNYLRYIWMVIFALYSQDKHSYSLQGPSFNSPSFQLSYLMDCSLSRGCLQKPFLQLDLFLKTSEIIQLIV